MTALLEPLLDRATPSRAVLDPEDMQERAIGPLLFAFLSRSCLP